MRAFAVNVADLVHRPGARRRERVVGRLPGLRVGATSVPEGADVAIDAVLEWVTDGVLASGDVSARWEGECRRCLTAVGGEVQVPFRELFEVRPRDGESYPLRGDQIDLAPLATEALLLELPLAPLCAAGCQGLCAVCGADLNAAPCGCESAAGDPRWAPLDVLRRDD